MIDWVIETQYQSETQIPSRVKKHKIQSMGSFGSLLSISEILSVLWQVICQRRLLNKGALLAVFREHGNEKIRVRQLWTDAYL